MPKINILFYIFTAIFSITAIITFLGITEKLTIKKIYLNALFTAVILEVAAATIISYKQIDFTCKTDEIINNLTKNIPEINESLSTSRKIFKIESLISSYQDSKNKINELERQITTCKDSMSQSDLTISRLDKVFYSNVIKLRLLAETFRGRTINLIWKKDKKKKVYNIIEEIFIDLGHINPNDELTVKQIINRYILFANNNGLEYLLVKNGEETYNQILLDEYATAVFLRKYLNQRYPLKK